MTVFTICLKRGLRANGAGARVLQCMVNERDTEKVGCENKVINGRSFGDNQNASERKRGQPRICEVLHEILLVQTPMQYMEVKTMVWKEREREVENNSGTD